MRMPCREVKQVVRQLVVRGGDVNIVARACCNHVTPKWSCKINPRTYVQNDALAAGPAASVRTRRRVFTYNRVCRRPRGIGV